MSAVRCNITHITERWLVDVGGIGPLISCEGSGVSPRVLRVQSLVTDVMRFSEHTHTVDITC